MAACHLPARSKKLNVDALTLWPVRRLTCFFPACRCAQSWTPYTPAERPHAAEAQAQGPKYAIRAVMLSEIRSVRRQTPPLGWNYVIIVLNTGACILALPCALVHLQPRRHSSQASWLSASLPGHQATVFGEALPQPRSTSGPRQQQSFPALPAAYCPVPGLAFPPLYFYDGGVRSFISAMRQHATLIK